jgi:hypothetical protein
MERQHVIDRSRGGKTFSVPSCPVVLVSAVCSTSNGTSDSRCTIGGRFYSDGRESLGSNRTKGLQKDRLSILLQRIYLLSRHVVSEGYRLLSFERALQ